MPDPQFWCISPLSLFFHISQGRGLPEQHQKAALFLVLLIYCRECGQEYPGFPVGATRTAQYSAIYSLQFVYKLYADFLMGKPKAAAPPKLSLIHGGPGMGKSRVRDSIANAYSCAGHYCLKTAELCSKTV